MRPYRFPALFVARWFASALLGRRRELGADGVTLLARRPHRIEGRAHIPRAGACIVVMNHYERPGLRVWWPAMLVTAAVARARPDRASVRWLVADRFYGYRLRGVRIPDAPVRRMLTLVARTYGLVLVPREGGARAGRSRALVEAARILAPRARGGEECPVGITPEAAYSEGARLAAVPPEAGVALAALSRGVVPLLPVAVHEDAGPLVASFGKPFVLPWSGLAAARREGDALTAQVMTALAALLPEELRGPYAAAPDEPSR